MNNSVNTIFVGGGPVGLWTAVQTKILNKQADIVVLEKHPVYQRSHVLQLNPNSLKGIPNDHRLRAIAEKFKNERHIRTNIIEDELTTLAHDLGIQIIHKEVTDPSTLKTEYPNAKVIVGSDGSHSVVRKEIFNNELDEKRDLTFIVEVKYEVEGVPLARNFKDSSYNAYPTMKVMGTYVQEHIGKERDGKTPISMRFFINNKTFNKMRGATFKHPYTLANANLIEGEVKSQIRTWFNLRDKNGETRVPESEKITVTRLGIYSSRKYVKVDPNNGVTYCLVGDAAFGVPFFRSLNNGFLSGTQLAKSIDRTLKGTPSLAGRALGFSFIQKGPYFSPYAVRLKVLAKSEMWKARIKSFLLDFLVLFIRLSAIVPWQVNYWTEAQISDLQSPVEGELSQLRR